MNFTTVNWTVFIVYLLAMTIILVYCLAELGLGFRYFKAKRKESKHPDITPDFTYYPMVTIQLPLYNELYVVERLIDSVMAFDYPKDKYEVQVLDDSTDESLDIAAKKIQAYQKQGFSIEHIRRPERKGFKAGALQYGLKRAKGDFIAIFDADFIPNPEFLKKTIPWFEEDSIGMVQTKWEHINKKFSLLTRLQAFALDLHFTVEQKGRNYSGFFINFNGTGGIWRKSCIIDAGGWKADTLTEDLDLSYRAQLKGWKFKYLEDVLSPAELPVEINALKSQQFRWNKGGAETAKKMMGDVFKSKIPVKTKFYAASHLLNSTIYVFILIAALLSVPMLIMKNIGFNVDVYRYISGFIIATIAIVLTYFISISLNKQSKWSRLLDYIVIFPLFLSVSLGLSLHNTLAVLRGYSGQKTPFIRTPKFNIINQKGVWKANKYINTKVNWLTMIEGVLALYFLYGIFLGFKFHDFGLMFFHVMAAFGFSFIFFSTVRHTIIAHK